MLRRPSSRRSIARGEIVLNLVPILDAMVTLIAFLLFTMSFLDLVHIQTPFPTINPEEQAKTISKKPLQLTLTLHENESEIWSPFDETLQAKIPNTTDGLPDFGTIHSELVKIRSRFPNERKLVLAPQNLTSYDVLVTVMDKARMLEPSDPTFYVKDPVSGLDIQDKYLFPEVVFGNLLGGDQ